MPKNTYLRVPLPFAVAGRIGEKAGASGVSAAVYAGAVLTNDVLGIKGESAPDAKATVRGRPVEPENADLSSRIERNGAIASGFTGVYPRGNRWMARWLYDDLGRFSTPEIAAIARYWFEQGRRSVARDTMTAMGTPREEAVRLSRYMGDGEPLIIAEAQPMKPPPVDPAAPPKKRRGRPPRARPSVIVPPGAVVQTLRDSGELPGTPGATAQDVFTRDAALAELDPSDNCCTGCGYDYRVCECPTPAGKNGDGSSDTTYDEPSKVQELEPGGTAPSTLPPSLGLFGYPRQDRPAPGSVVLLDGLGRVSRVIREAPVCTCVVPGVGKGPACHAERFGHPYQSDDWCNCHCHAVATT